MLYKLIFLLYFLLDLTTCGRILSKRNDIDLQTCISNFDIHKDKIIRTQDSRDMGAKYLNEIDLGSREECLRLCCETEDCDVFVFEEKNSGSCYLFHCGPPEDFKCKFTHHVNYSSAVLAINRHLPDLESQIKLTKHEQDLTKLRKPDVELEMNVVQPPIPKTTVSSTSTSTTVRTKEEVPAEKPKPPQEVSARKCSRYQFECRSTGECIAIYNACDGIPQCADGSDEAPELGCPETSTTSPSIPQHQNLAPPILLSNQNNPSQRLLHTSNISPPQDAYHLPAASQQNTANSGPVPVTRQQQQQQEDFIRPMMEARNPIVSHAVSYEPQQGAPYAPLPPQGDGGWIPHQSNQMPPQMNQYVDKNSHIFNHKETGLQVPEGQETSPMQYSEMREYQKVPNYYGDVYRQMPPSRENWDGITNDGYLRNGGYPRISPESSNIEHQPPASAPKQNYKELPPEHIINYKSEKENPSHVQEKMAQDLKHSKERMSNNETKKTKPEKHDHPAHREKTEQYPAVAAFKMVDGYEPQDGVAETPSGAILSLTLGLIITCVMAVLIGCRLRVVRRKMRKCGKSYAHDADYLVNGMYL